MRLSNCYFLLVTILQSTPVSPLNPMTAIFPLVFVLSISMAREGYEDYNRYKSDKGKSFISSIFNFIFYIYSLKQSNCLNS